MNSLNLSDRMLLIGKRGLSMHDDALILAKSFLNTGNLETHPDYLFISPAEGKKSMGVDEALMIVSKGSLSPALAKKIFVIINGIDCMTIQGQNKLLKLLEDNQNVIVIAIAYSNDVIATIKSRMHTITYFPLLLEDFTNSLPEEERSNALLLHFITGGCPGLVSEIKPYISYFMDVLQAIQEYKLENLLRALHMLKEKDKSAITSTTHIYQVIDFMEACFMDQMPFSVQSERNTNFCKPNDKYSIPVLLEILKLLQADKVRCSWSSYTKDNFFMLIANIICIAI